MKKLLSLFLLVAPIGLLAQSPPLSARFEVEPDCQGNGRIFVQVECTEDPFDVMEVWMTRQELNERGEQVVVDRMDRRRLDSRTFVISNLTRGGYYSVWLQGCDGKVVSVETYGDGGCNSSEVPFAPRVVNSTTQVEAEKPVAPSPSGRLVMDAGEVKKDLDHHGKPENEVVTTVEEKVEADVDADARRDDLVKDRARKLKGEGGSNMHSSGTSTQKPTGSGGGSGGGTPQSGGAKTTGNMSAKPR
ncbi:MAG: hypothetical protein H6596_01920 [Flavobacteriales bacterium]|nr:hypothetical protein [Flavobacteriales bacterium]